MAGINIYIYVLQIIFIYNIFAAKDLCLSLRPSELGTFDLWITAIFQMSLRDPGPSLHHRHLFSREDWKNFEKLGTTNSRSVFFWPTKQQ